MDIGDLNNDTSVFSIAMYQYSMKTSPITVGAPKNY